MPKPTRFRCDAVMVQLIITEYDEHDRPIGERAVPQDQLAKLFRAKTPDFWAEVDKAVTIETQPPPAPPTPGKKKGKSKQP